MKWILERYKIQILVGIFTCVILFYFPVFLSQFAIISYILYLGLFALLSRFLLAKKTSSTYTYASHLITFLIAYSIFGFMYYGFTHMSGFPMFL
jgi:hypothetical protein